MDTFPAAMTASPKTKSELFSLDDFALLQIAVPLESSKYSFIPMFLGRVLNLENDLLLLDLSPQKTKPKRPVEVLPQVLVPLDLWLIQDIGIRQLRLKTAILREVNSLLLLYAEQLRADRVFLIDDAALAAVERRVVENRLIDFSGRDASPERFDALSEADELDDTPDEQADEEYLLFLHRSTADAPDTLSRASTRPASASGSLHRILTFLRELVGSKRKFTFLTLSSHEERLQKSPVSLPTMAHSPAFNSQTNSSVISPSNGSINGSLHTANNSNSDTMRSGHENGHGGNPYGSLGVRDGHSYSSRDVSSTQGIHNNNHRTLVLLPTTALPVMPTTQRAHTLPLLHAAPPMPAPKELLHGLASGFLAKSRIYSRMKKRRELGQLVASTATSVSAASTPSQRIRQEEQNQLTASQRAENQRGKHEYYLQTKLLAELTQVLVGYLGKSGVRASLVRLMEFIKNSVFKFILVDMCQMVLDYGHNQLRATPSNENYL